MTALLVVFGGEQTRCTSGEVPESQNAFLFYALDQTFEVVAPAGLAKSSYSLKLSLCSL